jgi:hypothetical protein
VAQAADDVGLAQKRLQPVVIDPAQEVGMPQPELFGEAGETLALTIGDEADQAQAIDGAILRCRVQLQGFCAFCTAE